ncbi:MAG: hypothetical protein A2551_02995 [Elusimicrobia bacterium RIFOXYD2_FULL_34_30]|nr:MAG: hypothetical protein A2551_02995 [Elusimicrobia bacterium RIFOXYD2_FULL_34_30]
MTKRIIYITILVIVSIGVYFNSLYNTFAFDDLHIIKNNPLIKDPKNILLLFVNEYGAETDFKGTMFYRPLVMVSYLLTNAIFGLKPFWFHLGNVILNTFSVLAVFFLSKFIYAVHLSAESNKTKDFELAALISALFFAVHPVHVEVVSGIVGRSEIMAGFFCLTAFLFYIKEKRILSLMFFLLGLLCKETSVALIAFILVYEIIFNKKIRFTVINYFMVSIVYLFIKYFAIGGLFSTGSEIYFKEGLLTRIFTMSKVMVYYIKLMFIPYPLNPDWGISNVIPLSGTIFEIYVLLSLIIILALLVLSYKNIKTRPIIALSILWFFIFLLPVSNIIPIGDFMAERFLYLPSFGFCLLMGDIAFRNKKLLNFLPIVLILFSFITVKQNTVWRDNFALWNYVTKKFPENWRAFWELGKYYNGTENYEEAEKQYIKSLKLRETDLVLFDYAVILRKQNKQREALKIFEKYLNIVKDNPKMYLERAKCYNSIGDYKNALNDFNTANAISPKDDNIIYEIGRHFLLRNEFVSARSFFNKALEINGKNSAALVGLGVCYFQNKELKKSKEYFEKAMKIDSEYFEAIYNLIIVNIQLGNKKEAAQLFEKGKNLYPNDSRIKQIHSSIYPAASPK